MEVSSAKDFDYLFGKLKGDGSELLKEIENEDNDKKEEAKKEEEGEGE